MDGNECSNDSLDDSDIKESEVTDGIYHSICEQGRSTIDRQIDALNDIDTKSSQILRLNVLIIGALLTLASVSVRSEQFAINDFFNFYTISGLASLVVSTGFAGLTYTASDTEPGIRASEIRDILDEETPPEQYYENLSYGYARWIEFNNKTNIRNTPLIMITILLVIYGISFISIGVAEGVTSDPLPEQTVPVVIVFLLFLTLFSGVFGQIWKRIEIADPSSAITQSVSLPITITISSLVQVMKIVRFTPFSIPALRLSYRIFVAVRELIHKIFAVFQKLILVNHSEANDDKDERSEGGENDE